LKEKDMMNRHAMIAGLLLAVASPAFAQTAAAPSVQAGATVKDTTGAPVGTIESVNGPNAVLATGRNKVQVPLTSFAQGTDGLVFGLTQAQLDAEADKAAQASLQAALKPGAAVNDTTGAPVGTIESIEGSNAVLATAKNKVTVPVTGFVAGPNNTLVVGSTAAQIDAQAAAAAPTAPQASAAGSTPAATTPGA
jgi:hypothetical protein